jgi:aminoglycoside/choline kinase family phosphotransferase
LETGERDQMPSERYTEFLKQHGWFDKPLSFLAGDCSNRKYYRLGSEITGFILLMDAPPPDEKLEDFVEMSSILSDLGLSVPEIIACDLEKGLALIEDFGDTTYTKCFFEGDSRCDLYELATHTLIDLHKKFKKDHAPDLPTYTFDRYMKEVNLCLEWYYPTVCKGSLSERALKEWSEIWSSLLQPLVRSETLVLRDFMVDNLVYLKKRKKVQRCGLLDFQDAVLGPRAYDLVSLLEDARYDVPEEIQKKMLEVYLSAFPQLDRASFLRDYYALGAQRSIKILGVFSRMQVKQSQSKYLNHIPRVWKWIEQDMRHASLKPLKKWVDTYLPKK